MEGRETINPLSSKFIAIENEVREFKANSGLEVQEEFLVNYTEISRAIYYFCYECPLKNTLECTTCYLNKWKENDGY